MAAGGGAAGYGMQAIGDIGAMGAEMSNMVVGTIFGLLQMAMQNRAYQDTKYAAAGLGEYIGRMGYPQAGNAKYMYNLDDAQMAQLNRDWGSPSGALPHQGGTQAKNEWGLDPSQPKYT